MLRCRRSEIKVWNGKNYIAAQQGGVPQQFCTGR
jgi:hypothetical protein